MSPPKKADGIPLSLLQQQIRRKQDVRDALRKAHGPVNRPVRQSNTRR